MEGYTLAIDFPNRAAARHLIGRLEEMTEDAGGRLYLAKDALAKPKRMHAMYPELKDWQKAVAKADPEGVLTTDLIRRLNLRDV
jgi:decaprenylphospho-beta-D-ribofuranose 2-oxidase